MEILLRSAEEGGVASPDAVAEVKVENGFRPLSSRQLLHSLAILHDVTV